MNFKLQTVKEFKAIAKEHTLKRYSALRKDELIKFLLEKLPRSANIVTLQEGSLQRPPRPSRPPAPPPPKLVQPLPTFQSYQLRAKHTRRENFELGKSDSNDKRIQN